MNVKLNITVPKQTKIIFCLPAPSFSRKFFNSFLNLIDYFYKNNIQYVVSQHYSPVIYYARNLCLGGDVLRGENQKPFNGEIDYTHLMWIDSDIVFTPQQFLTLLDYDKNIVSGIYMMGDGTHFATVENWDEEYFQKNGTFKFSAEEDMEGRKGLIKVGYTGLGFMLVKKGVFESLKYPWFQPVFHEIGNCRDFSSEDVSFCKMITKIGYYVYVDPQIHVGHEKEVVL
jgi:hypothetical protein